MPLPFTRLAAAISVAALVASAFPSARAEADGPDHFSVRGVAAGDVLDIRAAPAADAAIIGSIPPRGDCVRNLGCRGGLTYQEFTTLSAAQRQQVQRERPRWCRVEYRGVQGWVAARYLTEGSCPP